MLLTKQEKDENQMELKEMIEVMQHYEDGGNVEFSDDNFEEAFGVANKKDNKDLSWNWRTFAYRIKESKQKATIEKWLCRDSSGDFVIIETSNIDGYRYLEKVKLIESYEIEL